MRRAAKKRRVVSKRSFPVPKVRRLKKVDNTRDIDLILSNEKLVQELLGVSNEKLNKLFEIAIQLLHQHRYEEASQSFNLLINMNPFVPDFWIGRGLVYQVQEDYKSALSDYLVAQTMDPSRSEPYTNAIECCVLMNDIKQAESIFRQGISYARKYPTREESRFLLSQLAAFQERIDDEKVVKQPQPK